MRNCLMPPGHRPALMGLPHWPPAVLLAMVLMLGGCASPPVADDWTPVDPQAFSAHAQTQQDDELKVTVAVLSNEEAQQALGVDLASRWIQAVWIEVENRDRHPYWLLLPSLDPNYFAPDEVAYNLAPGVLNDNAGKLMRRLRSVAFKNPISPGTAVAGYVFVSLDLDAKQIDVQLLSANRLAEFVFFLPVRGVNADTLFDVEHRKRPTAPIEVNADELRETLATYPCCTTNAEGTAPGDPLNLVLIGNAEDLFPAFVRRGWHAAEATYAESVRHTIGSYLFGQRYIYSPVSPLYAFGRSQDIAFQKARGSIHQRNHMRLWLTPLLFEGKEVWVGQISRDIGVKFTTKSPFLVTHVIDPDVDEARNGFVQDLLFSQGLVKVGYVGGVPPAPTDAPMRNLTDDPYFTDGLRAVLLLDQSPRAIREVQFFPWQHSPPHSGARQLDLGPDSP